MDTITGNSFYFDFEVRFMELLQTTLGEKAISIISFFSAFGEELILVLIMGFLFWCYDKEFGIYVGTNIAIGLVLNPMIKNIILRRRPYFDHETINCYRMVDSEADMYDIAAQGFSFPSGHSTNSITAYGSIYRYKKNRFFKVAAFALPLLVGFSRMIVGVHYPTDVLVGWLLGLVIILVFPMIIQKLGTERRWIAFLLIFLFGCIGLFYCKTSDYFTGLGILGGFFLSAEYERRFVRFEYPKSKIFYVTRILGGGMAYLIFNTLLKLPFDPEFLSSGTLSAGLIRLIRYFIVGFISIGLYPHLFKFEKHFIKKDTKSA